MAVKYIKTKITHIRLADPVLRLLSVPLSPLSVQVGSTHDGVWLGLVLVSSAVYFAAVLTQCYSLTHSVSPSPSLSQYKQLALISLSLVTRPDHHHVLCWPSQYSGSARLSYLLLTVEASSGSCSSSSSIYITFIYSITRDGVPSSRLYTEMCSIFQNDQFPIISNTYKLPYYLFVSIKNKVKLQVERKRL